MYWGAAAAVVLAVVIMLLTTPGERIPVNRRDVAGLKGADEKSSPRAADSFGAPALQVAQIAPVSSEQIVLPSANPRTAYFNAVAVAVKGGWLPAELQKESAASEPLKASDAEQGKPQMPQLTLRMKRNQVPLLKNALADAGLPAAGEKGSRGEEFEETHRSALRAAYARTAPNQAPKSSIAAGAGGAPAETEVDRISSAAAASGRQPVAEQTAQRTEAATPLPEARKMKAAEEPLVRVTLLFPLAESPVPAAPPAAGAASSATSE
jgi:hypothetical protein